MTTFLAFRLLMAVSWIPRMLVVTSLYARTLHRGDAASPARAELRAD